MIVTSHEAPFVGGGATAAADRTSSATNTAGTLTFTTAAVATFDEGLAPRILLQQSSALPLPHWWCIIAQQFICASASHSLPQSAHPTAATASVRTKATTAEATCRATT